MFQPLKTQPLVIPGYFIFITGKCFWGCYKGIAKAPYTKMVYFKFCS